MEMEREECFNFEQKKVVRRKTRKCKRSFKRIKKCVCVGSRPEYNLDQKTYKMDVFKRPPKALHVSIELRQICMNMR